MIYLMLYYCCVCWVAGAMFKEGDILHSWLEVAVGPLLFPWKAAEIVAYEVKTNVRRSGL